MNPILLTSTLSVHKYNLLFAIWMELFPDIPYIDLLAPVVLEDAAVVLN